MSDPLAPFPKDEHGRIRGGISKAFPHHQVEEALANGWIWLKPNCQHPLEDHGNWLFWQSEEPPWLPTED